MQQTGTLNQEPPPPQAPPPPTHTHTNSSYTFPPKKTSFSKEKISLSLFVRTNNLTYTKFLYLIRKKLSSKNINQ